MRWILTTSMFDLTLTFTSLYVNNITQTTGTDTIFFPKMYTHYKDKPGATNGVNPWGEGRGDPKDPPPPFPSSASGFYRYNYILFDFSCSFALGLCLFCVVSHVNSFPSYKQIIGWSLIDSWIDSYKLPLSICISMLTWVIIWKSRVFFIFLFLANSLLYLLFHRTHTSEQEKNNETKSSKKQRLINQTNIWRSQLFGCKCSSII
jgi:hypothetical protein